jgi:hypothetical protein
LSFTDVAALALTHQCSADVMRLHDGRWHSTLRCKMCKAALFSFWCSTDLSQWEVHVLRICKDILPICEVTFPFGGFRKGLIVIDTRKGRTKLGEFPLPYEGRGSLFGRVKGIFLSPEAEAEVVDPLVWRVLLQAGASKASTRRHYLLEHRLNTFDQWIDQQDSGYWEVFTTKFIGPGRLEKAMCYKGEVVVGLARNKKYLDRGLDFSAIMISRYIGDRFGLAIPSEEDLVAFRVEWYAFAERGELDQKIITE